MIALAQATNIESQKQAACWSCQADLNPGAQFCPQCGKLQPNAPADYFSFFGLPRRFVLDRGALEKKFYDLSRKLHPDLFVRATTQEQEWSLEKSSMLNDAWRTLRDPIRRTEYILGLEGFRLEEQSRDATDAALADETEKKQIVPPDLLEEVFELNMQLEEMRMAHAGGSDDPQLRRDLESAKRNFDAQMTAAEQKLHSLWSQWDNAADARDSERCGAIARQIVDLLNRRSYIRNLVRDVQAALDGPAQAMAASA